MKSILAVVKCNISNSIIALLVSLAVMVAATSSGEAGLLVISRGNYSYLFILMLPFFVVLRSFRGLMNLNAAKRDYYLGSLLTYAIAALGVSLVNTLVFLFIDPLHKGQNVVNLMELCGWTANGVALAAVQQFFFLLLAALFLHVLLSVQSSWYGWVADVALVAVISVFTPIEPLRNVLIRFFNLVMFNSNTLLHLAACLIGCVGLYFLGLAALKRKTN